MNANLFKREHPARILIVDDERLNRQLLEAMLEPEGFHLESAESGAEALELVAAQAPDLILLDIMMPPPKRHGKSDDSAGMNGYAVATSIKGNPTTRNIPIIMVTALDGREARMRGLKAGAEDFLTKPIDRAELCARVKNLLRLKEYGDYHDRYSQILESEVGARTIDLIESERRFADMLANIELASLMLDRDGRVTYCNDHLVKLLGWTREEILGQTWIERFIAPGPGRKSALEVFQNLLNEVPDGWPRENQIATQSGAIRLMRWNNSLLRSPAGLVIGTASIGEDITEQREAEEKLHNRDRQLQESQTIAGIGSWEVDLQTGVARWSEEQIHLLELQPGQEPSFELFLSMLSAEDGQRLRELRKRTLRTGEAFTLDHPITMGKGHIRRFQTRGEAVRDANGDLIRLRGTIQDITDRFQLESQLQQASKMDAVGKLASGVAHDFNNLLTVILGFTELVASDVTIAEVHRGQLNEIKKAAERAMGLTRQLLAFSRQQVLHSESLNVNTLIVELIGMLGRLVGENYKFVLTLAPALPLALADHGQVEQVVMNLVVNARDAMPGGGTIAIETADVELENSSFHAEEVVPGHYVMIAITDKGTGMSKETQARLFEPFYTTKETGKGTGLGLSTTYGIIKQSKGHIWVYSEPGLGTTFKAYFPRSDRLEKGKLLNGSNSVAALKQASETLMLVEDEPGVRQLSKIVLVKAGYRVLEATNGDEAEKLFAANVESIRLVVTDVVMPGCGGPELLRRLHVHAPDLRVLYMSGYTEPASRMEAGFDRGVPFIQKPFTAADLLRKVREAIDA